MLEKRRVAVFGAGYIGLVTGACFAQLGHDVVVRDIQKERIDILQNGGLPIHEDGLGELIAENADRLTFTLDAEEAVRDSDVVYVCVDTPPTPSGDADLSRIWQVISTLREARHLAAVVVKSTVPVGTGARVRAAMDRAGLQHVGYASNPEFTAEGQAVRDFMHPDRVVIGADDPEIAKLVAQLHEGVDGPVVEMDIPSAEMVKLAANALLATKISFANEIATICEATGADVEHVVQAVGLDHRLGPHYMKPGVGWGGSCFPKDSRALRAMASNSGYSFQMLSSVIEVNDLQPRRAIQRLKDELDGFLADRTVALLGIAFKPGTDDVREAPSTILASRLLAEGAAVRCWDPLARSLDTAPWSSTTRYATPLEAMTGADAVIIVTDWPELRDVAWDRAAAAMTRPLMFDGRNLLEPQRMGSLGFTYMSVGRRTVRGTA
ncbi:UDP-glucose/GDP-mannose dehydrogenase family protein [Streptomyces sp. V4I2]|uniref:UDP-glucose dehydrogenase family protein n=1 Tax=Streptomyces sp. V4I2 TaxID=3042280 RepID=UPI00278B624C|nr:UDP-glucose/GDP-mannose dehydrogenase family protein [Streptomyces sp. V4I2]MDQ1052011.1 UDPglucose 6-dehydrogenase [Streptomyces sp. V4I2]